MANLTFQSILATGSKEMGDAKGPEGAGVFDFFFRDIDLPEFSDLPALLVLAVKNVDLDKNFITINAPGEVVKMSYDEASDKDFFVWRVLPNPSDTWVLQMHQIPAGRMRPENNVLGIHTRNEKGEQARSRDNFAVARVFLAYHASK